MQRTDYDIQVAQIEQDCADKLELLKKEFALANNPYKKGQIVEDHYNRVRIEMVSIHDTACVYRGISLTKKNVPKKNQDNNYIYQVNVVRIIEE